MNRADRLGGAEVEQWNALLDEGSREGADWTWASEAEVREPFDDLSEFQLRDGDFELRDGDDLNWTAAPRQQRELGGEPLSMEALGLNPNSVIDCEVYDGYVEVVAEEEVATPLWEWWESAWHREEERRQREYEQARARAGLRRAPDLVLALRPERSRARARRRRENVGRRVGRARSPGRLADDDPDADPVGRATRGRRGVVPRRARP